MAKKLYHQSENTFRAEISTRIYGANESEVGGLHFHKNFELLAVIKGECVCAVGGTKYCAKEGEAIFICPFQIHGFTLGEGSRVRRITFHEHLILTLSQTLDGMRPASPIFRLDSSIGELLLTKMNEFFGDGGVICGRITPQDVRMQVKGMLYLIGGDLVKKVELVQTPTADTVVIAVAQYISENFKEDITLCDVAKEKGYNYQYLSRIFNRVMGMNFKKMLNLYRLEHAYALLQDTDSSISEICFESGFQSIRSFNQVCREIYGKSPKELKRG